MPIAADLVQALTARAGPPDTCVTDQDSTVADYVFLMRLDQHMRSQVEGAFSEERSGRIIVSGVQTLYPEEPEHFGTAARTVPFAHVGPAPGSR